MKTIELLISPQGEVTVKTQGYFGSACQSASRWIEEALGIREREQLTPEYFAACSIQQHQLEQRADGSSPGSLPGS